MATRYSSGCRSRDDTYGNCGTYGTYGTYVGTSLYRTAGTYGTYGTSLYHGTYGRYRTGRYMEERKFEPISNRDSSLSGPRCRRGRERTVPVTVTLRLGVRRLWPILSLRCISHSLIFEFWTVVTVPSLFESRLTPVRVPIA